MYFIYEAEKKTAGRNNGGENKVKAERVFRWQSLEVRDRGDYPG